MVPPPASSDTRRHERRVPPPPMTLTDSKVAANLPGLLHYRRFTAKQRSAALIDRLTTCDFTVGSSSPLRGVATRRPGLGGL